jgi:hypothetical protein
MISGLGWRTKRNETEISNSGNGKKQNEKETKKSRN